MRKGYTTAPCKGCGKVDPYGRKAGQVCGECQGLLKEARAAREAASKRQDAVPYAVPQTGAWPSFSLHARAPRIDWQEQVEERLKRALQATLAGLWEEIPGSVAHDLMPVDPTSRHGWKVPIPELLTVDRTSSYSHRKTSALIEPRRAEQIQALDAILREAFAAEYQAGLSRGANLLGGLAAGEISADELNKATALGLPEAVRRVYKEE